MEDSIPTLTLALRCTRAGGFEALFAAATAAAVAAADNCAEAAGAERRGGVAEERGAEVEAISWAGEGAADSARPPTLELTDEPTDEPPVTAEVDA